MCTSPIKIVNRSRWIAPDRGQQLFMYVPCGHCVECINKKKLEWSFRTFHECKSTISDGGYVLFDTLTYAPEYLPRLSDFIDVPKSLDFSCFRHFDITLFFKRLRQYLTRKGYEVQDNLRYFLVSEYGTREDKTKRPHYHVFFFVRKCFISPLELSRAISFNWFYGRTDGVPFKTSSYVQIHNVFNSMDLATRRCISYVSKYVSKDFGYSDMVRNRLFRLMCSEFDGFDWQMSRKQKDYYKMLQRFVSPFHVQSLNYGNGYIKEIGLSRFIDCGTITSYNSKGIPFTFGLFPSLKRKIFYNYRKVNGDVQFYLNCNGYLFKRKSFGRQVLNLRKQIDNYNLFHNDKINLDSYKFVFEFGRLQSSDMSLEKQIDLSNTCTEYNSLRNYSGHDISFIHRPIFTKGDFGSKKHGFLQCQILSEKPNPFSLSSHHFVSLQSLARFAVLPSSMLQSYQRLLDWFSLNGSRDMVVARHKERIKNHLKLYNLC